MLITTKFISTLFIIITTTIAAAITTIRAPIQGCYRRLNRHYFMLLIGILAALCTPRAYAQKITDVDKWLKSGIQEDTSLAESTPQRLPDSLRNADKHPPDKYPPANHPPAKGRALIALTHSSALSIKDDNFQASYHKTTRANRAKLRRHLNESVKINLRNDKKAHYHHRFYIHSLERALVAKGYSGIAHYEITLHRKQAKLQFALHF